MKQIYLQFSGTTVADWFWKQNYPTLDIDLNAKIGDAPKYVTVKVMLFKTPLLAVYKNNGKTFFNDGDRLENYSTDDPKFWDVIRVYSENHDRLINFDDAEFVFSANGLDWDGKIKMDVIKEYFKFNSSGQAPFADFVGFYKANK